MEFFELSEFFWRMNEAFSEHWPVVVLWLLFVIVPLVVQSMLIRRAWRSHHHDDIIHISQNSVEMRKTGKENADEPWLILDVHGEFPLEAILHHPVPQKIVRAAAKKTMQNQPLIGFAPEDRWHILNMVRNGIATPFLIGTARKMIPMAGKTVVVPCVFALTYERYPGMRHGKIRAILVSQELLMSDLLNQPLRVEDDTHRDRITTLHLMRADYAKGNAAEYCMEVRLNIPV